MAGRRFLYLTSLTGSLVFYCFYQEWLAWFLLIFLLMLPVFSLIVSLPGILCASALIQVPERTTAGTHLTAAVNDLGRLPAPSVRGKLLAVNSITGCGQTVRLGQLLPTEICGNITVKPFRLKISDYLGLFSFPFHRCLPARLLIMPIPIADPVELSRAGSRQRESRTGYSNDYELRSFRPGDRLQQIHWKLSAKTGALICREPLESPGSSLRIVLNLQGPPKELNRILGKLVWLSSALTAQGDAYEITVRIGTHSLLFQITSEQERSAAIDRILTCSVARAQSTAESPSIQLCAGGEQDDA